MGDHPLNVPDEAKHTTQYQHGCKEFPAAYRRGDSWGAQPNSGELHGGVGGTFGRHTLLDTATSQKLLDCTHSREGGGTARVARGDRKRAWGMGGGWEHLRLRAQQHSFFQPHVPRIIILVIENQVQPRDPLPFLGVVPLDEVLVEQGVVIVHTKKHDIRGALFWTKKKAINSRHRD